MGDLEDTIISTCGILLGLLNYIHLPRLPYPRFIDLPMLRGCTPLHAPTLIDLACSLVRNAQLIADRGLKLRNVTLTPRVRTRYIHVSNHLMSHAQLTTALSLCSNPRAIHVVSFVVESWSFWSLVRYGGLPSKTSYGQNI